MLVSYKWLKKLVAIDVPSSELSEKMSTTGIEVEGVSQLNEGLSKLIVGQIVEKEKIPDTHLTVCQVDIGEEEPIQVVCGGKVVDLAMKTIVAIPGARIVGNRKIKKGKIRGVSSFGMLCSLSEIGVPDSVIPKDYQDNIYRLPDDALVGDSIFKYLDLDDEIIELAITPNRADALSMRGVAHEVAAIYDKPVYFEKKSLVETAKNVSDVLSVEVAAKEIPFYAARVVENVVIKPSPQWLQNVLMNQGIRPINNVVDITNYVLLYFGQPMHAFDYDKFEEKTIVARLAKEKEMITTLDGEERSLTAEDMVITVADKPVALAGVMGGQSTEIDDNTQTVVLEAAVFDGQLVRKTSSRLNLRSESSSRFEKGINHATVIEALDYAAAMLTELAEGSVLSGMASVGQLQLADKVVSTNLDYVNTRLGTELVYTDIEKIMAQLGFGVSGDASGFSVSVPPRRWDIAIEADLVEEIARIYGYDKLPTTLPSTGGTIGELTRTQKLRRKIRSIIEAQGLSEVISYALTTPEKAIAFNQEPQELTELMWPMTSDRSVLRQNILSGMLDIIAYNTARNLKNIAIYEIGKIFKPATDETAPLPNEVGKLAFAITGLVADKDFQTKATPVDFFYAKGVLETLFRQLNISVDYQATKMENMHPGRTALILKDEEVLGFVGQIHPQVAKDYDLSETYVAEIDLQKVEELWQTQIIFKDVIKYPAVSRDLALLVDVNVTHDDIISVIEKAKVKNLKDIKLFDVYSGSTIETGKKSMAYSLTFQKETDSLTDEEVTNYIEKIITALAIDLNAEIR
ncbi:phenylalanine--tRNA ligase subunit beta [Streptococcus pacificus]|uniref:Phenylalanine--tRNA ligase beta subunit n=1 Tax=Streptococcus pacificus TaxID=2740577 RepID=A0ABS0ZK29_9STRE|nr:phenylalanine--tRNA ligase subunit beta [Streptococcus pacificus]MBJ8325891.1 phenylalanine--tRNA ligase subunit beta [Streptococcus pacificus]